MQLITEERRRSIDQKKKWFTDVAQSSPRWWQQRKNGIGAISFASAEVSSSGSDSDEMIVSPSSSLVESRNIVLTRTYFFNAVLISLD
jgi:hypothetical protein